MAAGAQDKDEIGRFRGKSKLLLLKFFVYVVIIRVRPFLSIEKNQGGKKGRMQCVETYHPHDDKSLSLVRPGFDQRDFRFDNVLDMDAS